MGDFDIGQATRELFGSMSASVREAGVEPRDAIRRVDIPHDELSRRAGHHAEADPGHADMIAREHGHDLKPILVIERVDGYVVLDGVHRAEAARLTDQPVPALVIDRVALRALSDSAHHVVHDWAHHLYGVWG